MQLLFNVRHVNYPNHMSIYPYTHMVRNIYNTHVEDCIQSWSSGQLWIFIFLWSVEQFYFIWFLWIIVKSIIGSNKYFENNVPIMMLIFFGRHNRNEWDPSTSVSSKWLHLHLTYEKELYILKVILTSKSHQYRMNERTFIHCLYDCKFGIVCLARSL